MKKEWKFQVNWNFGSKDFQLLQKSENFKLIEVSDKKIFNFYKKEWKFQVNWSFGSKDIQLLQKSVKISS